MLEISLNSIFRCLPQSLYWDSEVFIINLNTRVHNYLTNFLIRLNGHQIISLNAILTINQFTHNVELETSITAFGVDLKIQLLLEHVTNSLITSQEVMLLLEWHQLSLLEVFYFKIVILLMQQFCLILQKKCLLLLILIVENILIPFKMLLSFTILLAIQMNYVKLRVYCLKLLVITIISSKLNLSLILIRFPCGDSLGMKDG